MSVRFIAKIAFFGMAMFIVTAIGFSAADPATVEEKLVVPAGAGAAEIGRDPEADSEGPTRGPLATLADATGLTVLDAVNQRIMTVDLKGAAKVLTKLPEGSYDNLTRGSDGTLYTIDSTQRTLLSVKGDAVTTVASLAASPDMPKQFDHFVVIDKTLVVGDFGSNRLYFLDLTGKVLTSASWPVALSLVAAPQGQVAYLGTTDYEKYNMLQFVDRTGTAMKTVTVTGDKVAPFLAGARLVGFLGDGRAVAFGFSVDDKDDCMVFVIGKEGGAEPIVQFKGSPLFANRYGEVVDGKSVWINTSMHKETTVSFRRLDVK